MLGSTHEVFSYRGGLDTHGDQTFGQRHYQKVWQSPLTRVTMTHIYCTEYRYGLWLRLGYGVPCTEMRDED